MNPNPHQTIVPFPGGRGLLDNTVIVFLDLQREYLASGRAYALEQTQACLANCRRLLQLARASGMTIAHMRLFRPESFFNPATEFSNFIEEFRPRASEMVFEREQLSIFSNEAFSSFVDNIASSKIVLAGLSGQRGCLASAVDAQQREHSLIYLEDASASHMLGGRSEADSHRLVSEIIGGYAETLTTDHFCRRLSKLASLSA